MPRIEPGPWGVKKAVMMPMIRPLMMKTPGLFTMTPGSVYGMNQVPMAAHIMRMPRGLTATRSDRYVSGTMTIDPTTPRAATVMRLRVPRTELRRPPCLEEWMTGSSGSSAESVSVLDVLTGASISTPGWVRRRLSGACGIR